jgi:hypothetical protein
MPAIARPVALAHRAPPDTLRHHPRRRPDLLPIAESFYGCENFGLGRHPGHAGTSRTATIHTPKALPALHHPGTPREVLPDADIPAFLLHPTIHHPGTGTRLLHAWGSGAMPLPDTTPSRSTAAHTAAADVGGGGTPSGGVAPHMAETRDWRGCNAKVANSATSQGAVIRFPTQPIW